MQQGGEERPTVGMNRIFWPCRRRSRTVICGVGPGRSSTAPLAKKADGGGVFVPAGLDDLPAGAIVGVAVDHGELCAQVPSSLSFHRC